MYWVSLYWSLSFYRRTKQMSIVGLTVVQFSGCCNLFKSQTSRSTRRDLQIVKYAVKSLMTFSSTIWRSMNDLLVKCRYSFQCRERFRKKSFTSILDKRMEIKTSLSPIPFGRFITYLLHSMIRCNYVTVNFSIQYIYVKDASVYAIHCKYINVQVTFLVL